MQRKNTSLGAGDAEALQESSLALKIPKITATSRSAQERRARPRRMATPDKVARRTSAATRAEPAARPSPLAVFTARCEARALLWAARELTLHQAADELQVDAVASGLVAEVGQDAVQAVMAKAFARVR
jgi:hypothetical protein